MPDDARSRDRWLTALALMMMGLMALGYVIVNLTLFTLNAPADQMPPALGMIAYAAVAVGVSSGGAYSLWSRREKLR
jgi:hypothetical protein